jgi:hypothetical protein
MSADQIDIDIQTLLDPAYPLPQPLAALILPWLDRQADDDRRGELATEISRRWLAALGGALDPLYRVDESRHFLVLGPQVHVSNDSLLRTAEHCRARMLALLPGLADFRAPGKEVLVVLYGETTYYNHVAYYDSEGEFGSSAGMHIRSDWPHVVLLEVEPTSLHRTVAHELTHAAFAHLGLPLWIEEGLAQLAEHDISGEGAAFDYRRVRLQKEHWRALGLDTFWSGEAFSRSDDSQEFSYQLAEILVRLLLEEFRPRWFGWDQRPLEHLLVFLRHAKADDAGQSAAKDCLQMTLGELATKSLGSGDWEPPNQSADQ